MQICYTLKNFQKETKCQHRTHSNLLSGLIVHEKIKLMGGCPLTSPVFTKFSPDLQLFFLQADSSTTRGLLAVLPSQPAGHASDRTAFLILPTTRLHLEQVLLCKTLVWYKEQFDFQNLAISVNQCYNANFLKYGRKGQIKSHLYSWKMNCNLAMLFSMVQSRHIPYLGI